MESFFKSEGKRNFIYYKQDDYGNIDHPIDFNRRFLKDLATKVCINENDDAGKYLFAMQVKGDGFWLNAFKTEKEVMQFIDDNCLQLA